MLRVALRPRFLGLLALMIAATLVCGLLATWQWDRAHRAMVAEKAAPARAVPLEKLLSLGGPVTNDAAGRSVSVRGTFDPREQILVPDRSIDGADAVIVVTALRVPQADGSTARLVVARGWIPAADLEDADGHLDASRVPAPPTGEVELVGHLEASESASAGITDGTAREVSTQLLVNTWGAPMYSAYLAETTSATGLHAMPLAQSAFSRGLNLQNLGYAAQWIVFGLFFLYLWWRSVRTAFLDEQAERDDALRERLGGDGAAPDDGAARQEDHGRAAPAAVGARRAPSGASDGPRASRDAKEDPNGADTTSPG